MPPNGSDSRFSVYFCRVINARTKVIYPDNFESKIKFDTVRQGIAGRCHSDMGRQLVDAIAFSSDADTIRANVELTAEFMRILQEEEFPDEHYADARPFLNKIRIEGLYIDLPEAVALKNSLESLTAIVRFFNGKAERFPRLCEKAAAIQLFPAILQRLDAILTKHGTVKDSASPTLNEIRRGILKKQSGISRRMQALLQQAQSEGWADKESAIAIRDGRMVIPVPAAYKRRINGIVHDESTTGKTSFIEPTEIVETNNEIRELQLEEKREIIRILRDFSDFVRPHVDELVPAYDFLAEVDFIQAKAAFSAETSAISPIFHHAPDVQWVNATHPLLSLSLKKNGKAMVPLNMQIDEKQRIILISGPNAGGKSVCLQTVGLLQYMFQCGLPVPVDENSRFGIFKNILIDIGDEQSIENDLSTYSSHLINMKNFVRYGDESTLILIDEFGTGTEPMLGGAIAEAILHALNDKGVKGVITTHYTNLKHFAAATPGIENGAMLYDSNRMMPLFELQIGKPGSSFAFEIARKIGLPKEILDEAAAKIGEDHFNYDKHLKEIARDKRYWEEKRKKIHENEKQLDTIVEKYGDELKEASRLRKEILREAKEKAEDILASANKTIESTIREIRESQADKERTKAARAQVEEQKRRLLEEEAEETRLQQKMERLKAREARKKQREPKQPTTTPQRETPPAPLQKGDFVEMPNRLVGEIIELKGDKAVVALGDIRINTSIQQLKRSSSTRIKKQTHHAANASYNEFQDRMREKRMTFKPEIDVRGLRGDEAVQKVSDFIDDAVMLDCKNLRILHGTGTGALRHVIREQLATNPAIAEYGDEQVQLGGTGITVVLLK